MLKSPSSCLSPMIDDAGNFTRGKYPGEPVYKIARQHPDYIYYILEFANLTSDDRQMLETLLRQYGH